MELWEWDLRAPARTWRFDEVVGCVALQASGELLLGLERGLCSFDVSSGAITLVTPFEEGRDTRPNDGRCGPMISLPAYRSCVGKTSSLMFHISVHPLSSVVVWLQPNQCLCTAEYALNFATR